MMVRARTWRSVIADEARAVRDDRASLRRFGLTMGVALAVLGGLLLWRGRIGFVPLFFVAGALLTMSLAVPVALRPILRVWMTFAIALGWVMTRVILTIVFYVAVTPIALIARLFRKRFLVTGFEPQRESYWERRPKPSRGIERYESQF